MARKATCDGMHLFGHCKSGVHDARFTVKLTTHMREALAKGTREEFAPNLGPWRGLEKRGLAHIKFVGQRWWKLYVTRAGEQRVIRDAKLAAGRIAV